MLLLGGGPSSGHFNAVQVQGKCWRCGQESHSGRAPVSVRKTTCKAYNSTCLKCCHVGHYTKLCKKNGEKKTKEEEVTANTVQIMHITMSTTHINLCRFRVSGNEIEYNQAIRKQLRTRPNVTLSNEEYQQLSNKFVEQKPALSPKIQVNVFYF